MSELACILLVAAITGGLLAWLCVMGRLWSLEEGQLEIQRHLAEKELQRIAKSLQPSANGHAVILPFPYKDKGDQA